jgi:hypothetical protein
MSHALAALKIDAPLMDASSLRTPEELYVELLPARTTMAVLQLKLSRIVKAFFDGLTELVRGKG